MNLISYNFEDIKIIEKREINYFNEEVRKTYSLEYAVYILGIKFYFHFSILGSIIWGIFYYITI